MDQPYNRISENVLFTLLLARLSVADGANGLDLLSASAAGTPCRARGSPPFIRVDPPSHDEKRPCWRRRQWSAAKLPFRVLCDAASGSRQQRRCLDLPRLAAATCLATVATSSVSRHSARNVSQQV